MSLAMQALCMSEEQKDVVFFVGPDEANSCRFPAHKLVLAAASPVFTAMFGENFQKTREVFVTDVTSTAFRSLLRFAYTGELDTATVATYKDILHAADKYLMPKLSKHCFSKFAQVDVCFDNFWYFFSIIRTFYSEIMPAKIVTGTLSFLDENATIILASEEWKNQDLKTVSKILKRSTLHVDESDVISCVFKWSKSKCSRQKLEINADNLRMIAQRVARYIRFLLLPRATLIAYFEQITYLTAIEKKIILESSLRKGGSLPPPWNNDLLIEPREKSDILEFLLDPNGIVVTGSSNVSAVSFLLVVSKDCIFQTLQLNVVGARDIRAKINGDISDLEGNIYCTWSESKSKGAQRGSQIISTGTPICLKKFKAYAINLACNPGKLASWYNCQGLWNGANNKAFFLLGNFPNNDTTVKEFKSRDFWKKILSRDCSVAKFSDSVRNCFVGSVTFTI